MANLTIEEITETARSLISESLGLGLEDVSPESSFIDDLGADSLDEIEILLAFEEEFGVEIPDDDAEKVVTVRDAVELVDRLLREPA